MMDPDAMQIQKSNLPDLIKIGNIPEFDTQCYCLEDDKDFEKYIKDIEAQVRRSFEYRAFIKYIRENMDMNKCAFLKGVSNNESFDIKIEIHHYPFTLRDIVEIVIRKKQFYNENMQVQMVAKEVMELHYKLIIGLIPLSETVHELTHNGRLFIPVDRVLGRYKLFITFYEQFCSPEQLETLRRIEEYTKNNSDLLDTTIIENNNVNYQVKDNNYLLPQTRQITDDMIMRIEAIKSNNYILPVAPNNEHLLPVNKYNKPFCPIFFDESLIKK